MSCSHLLVVAHPDDESIFFGGLLQTRNDWQVVCVTDGNANGLGKKRKREFLRACEMLKVKKSIVLGLPDIWNTRLEVDLLMKRLKGLGQFKKVFTHGILGEYGHQHHSDVSFATHKVFSPSTPVYSLSYNTYPEMRIQLTAKQFERKAKIVWNIYKGETRQLLHHLPVHSYESYLKVSLGEVEAIYNWLTLKKKLETSVLKAHKWLIPYLKTAPPYYFLPYINGKKT